MASPTPTPPPASDPGPPPPAPSADASPAEWRAWRQQQRDYARAQWRRGVGNGPWGPYGGWWWPAYGGWVWGALLVLAGIYFLLSNLNLLNWLKPDIFWPIVLILFGVWLIFRRGRWWRW